MSSLLAVCGLPGCGKTTLANELGKALGLSVLHTDDHKELPWAEQADAVMDVLTGFGNGGYQIVEGFTVCRLFKRGFEPDCVIYILGGDKARSPKGMRTQLERGLDLYGGRVITLPEMPSLNTALWALGTPDAE